MGSKLGVKIEKIDANLKSNIKCLLASIFCGFWWVLGTKLGGKIEPRSIKNGIEKTIEKRKAARWPARRSKSLRGRGKPTGQLQGEGVGGEVNLSLDGFKIVASY